MPEDFDVAEYLKRQRLKNIFGGMPGVQVPETEALPQHPAMEAYKKYVSTEPELKDYHPGKLRQILAAIAGGAVGLGSGDVGAALHEKIVRGPFEKKEEEFEQGSRKRRVAAELETEEAKRRRELLTSEARVGELSARAGAEGARQRLQEKQAKVLPESLEEETAAKERVRKAGVRPPTPARPVSLGPGHQLVDPVTGKKIAEVPEKIKEDEQLFRDADTNEIVRVYKDAEGKHQVEVVREPQRERKPEKPEGTIMLVPDEEGGHSAVKVTPGFKVPPGSITPAGASSMEVPTSATRTMIEKAPKVIALADGLEKLVKDQTKKLGAWNSRVRAGKRAIGLPDPDFERVQDQSKLLMSLLANMHVGARGGIEIMKRFDEMMGAGYRSPDNMLAAIDTIREYAKTVSGTEGVSEIRRKARQFEDQVEEWERGPDGRLRRKGAKED